MDPGQTRGFDLSAVWYDLALGGSGPANKMGSVSAKRTDLPMGRLTGTCRYAWTRGMP